ncbi:hypothetical protein EVAR_17561_1 [Eumeta japonica]|uniref:Uncharacterized protein n=1 Tax=Eumeta variegata TaxID=151549 RepID=A0A4C1UDD0_EUMVA|nr:hypothetical protein EVAR_17561_1 [Eumeta japonica]
MCVHCINSVVLRREEVPLDSAVDRFIAGPRGCAPGVCDFGLHIKIMIIFPSFVQSGTVTSSKIIITYEIGNRTGPESKSSQNETEIGIEGETRIRSAQRLVLSLRALSVDLQDKTICWVTSARQADVDAASVVTSDTAANSYCANVRRLRKYSVLDLPARRKIKMGQRIVVDRGAAIASHSRSGFTAMQMLSHSNQSRGRGRRARSDVHLSHKVDVTAPTVDGDV